MANGNWLISECNFAKRSCALRIIADDGRADKKSDNCPKTATQVVGDHCSIFTPTPFCSIFQDHKTAKPQFKRFVQEETARTEGYEVIPRVLLNDVTVYSRAFRLAFAY